MQASATPALRVLTAADAAAYNAFLGEGVLAHPDTLRISPGDIARAPFKTESGAEGCTFAACAEDGSFLGVVTVEREAGRGPQHARGRPLRKRGLSRVRSRTGRVSR